MIRSNAPVTWLLFGAGGVLAALIGVGLVFVTGIGAPLQLFGLSEILRYEHALAICQSVWGKLIVFAIITLFFWHAALRIFHLLHGFGVARRNRLAVICFGISLLCTIASAYWITILGF